MRTSSMKTEAHKITCPYCLVGWAIVSLKRDGLNLELNLHDHPKCVTCHRYFKIKPRLSLHGEQLDKVLQVLSGSGGH